MSVETLTGREAGEDNTEKREDNVKEPSCDPIEFATGDDRFTRDRGPVNRESIVRGPSPGNFAGAIVIDYIGAAKFICKCYYLFVGSSLWINEAWFERFRRWKADHDQNKHKKEGPLTKDLHLQRPSLPVTFFFFFWCIISPNIMLYSSMN